MKQAREAPEATASQTGVDLLVEHRIEAHAELGECLPCGVEKAGGDQVVQQQPTEHVLEGKVVDGVFGLT